MTQLAITAEFLESLAKLPKRLQKKVREFTRKFADNSHSSAINYEKIHNVLDQRVRTVRIDQQYRAIVLHPNEGDVYVMLWVDNHDEAMAWASAKRFDVNPETHAFQIYDPAAVDEVSRTIRRDQDTVAGESTDGTDTARLFEQHEDQTLVSLGVPEVLVPAVREVRDLEDLKAIACHLPAEAGEALYWLADNLPLEEIRAAISIPSASNSSVPTVAESLEHPDSRRRLVKIKSIDELERVLDASLEQWRIFLHPTQQTLVAMDTSGPVIVEGGAGTGKTVVALHRAKHLALNVFQNSSDRILFTTFTANLAEAISRQLDLLCGAERSRIEVVHIDQLARRMLDDTRIEIASSADLMHCWDLSVTENCPLSAPELQHEWTYASEIRGISDERDYLRMSRVGQSKSLDRLQRKQVWQAFEAFQSNMKNRGLQAWSSVIREATENSVAQGPKYAAVLVDESQDFTAPAWRLIRSLAKPGPNDLFLVGDAHQRIYGCPIRLKECGIDVGDRKFLLRVNYRTTEEIRDWAFSRFSNRDSARLAGESGARSDVHERSLLSGPNPELVQLSSREEEIEYCRKLIPELLKEFRPEEIVVCARAAWILRDFKKLFHDMDQPYVVLEKIRDESNDGIRLATIHRIKGLEFRCVLIVSVNAGIIPCKFDGRDDDNVSQAQHKSRERALLYVATTRARDRVIISTSGKASSLLQT
ncbi:MAG: UvrD-helicase domain-containing protein [Pirellulaceae bacterium]|nr:UvrD-helicase domain-containing protein [Pirellulaceae bacterium]